jgi:hypothetical protein
MTENLLSVHDVEGEPMPPMEEMQPIVEAVDRFDDKLKAEGVWVFAGGLHPIESATTVDGTGDEPAIATTDNPAERACPSRRRGSLAP